MTPRLLVITAVALPAIFGAHLTAFLLLAVTVTVIVVHLLPLIAALAIPATALFLFWLIAAKLRRDGWGCAPMRKATA